jgi:hypothetical protein
VLPPAATCAICARSLTDTGGKRLVCCAPCGIRRRTIQTTLGEFDARSYPARVLRLTDNYRDVIVWLTGRMWTDEAASRASASFQRGEQAWVCQRLPVGPSALRAERRLARRRWRITCPTMGPSSTPRTSWAMGRWCVPSVEPSIGT